MVSIKRKDTFLNLPPLELRTFCKIKSIKIEHEKQKKKTGVQSLLTPGRFLTKSLTNQNHL
jgi:hypothetical protein